MKAILIGNGLDIQVGGNDYLNKWIIIRLLAKSKMGKYDALFENTISGDEIIALFNGMLNIANKARNREYDEIISRCAISELSTNLKNTLTDFVNNHKSEINSIEEIGMEDWVFLFQLYLIEQKDLLNNYNAVKQGYQQMLLDAIFCEGKIQRLYDKLSKKAKEFFGDFDHIFTLNYDNMIKKATKCNVYHLHGDFNTLHMSENPKNALGYYNRKNKLIKNRPEWKHCNSTAIVDYSGNLKYKFATQNTNLYKSFENEKQLIREKKILKEKYLSNAKDEVREILELGIEKNLSIGHNYYFEQFENLSGELIVIGMAPENDSHIFDCINKSEINHVKFYYYFGTTNKAEISEKTAEIKLNINKSYEILNIQELWEELGITPPEKKIYDVTPEQLKCINDLCLSTPITEEELLYQVNSIPSTTRKVIIEMLNSELEKEKYHKSPQSKKELLSTFKDFGETLKIASLSPQALYYLYFESSKKSRNKVK